MIMGSSFQGLVRAALTWLLLMRALHRVPGLDKMVMTWLQVEGLLDALSR